MGAVQQGGHPLATDTMVLGLSKDVHLKPEGTI